MAEEGRIKVFVVKDELFHARQRDKYAIVVHLSVATD